MSVAEPGLKIAGRITETATRVRMAFAAACPESELFRRIARCLQFAGPRHAGQAPLPPNPADPSRLSPLHRNRAETRRQLTRVRRFVDPSTASALNRMGEL